MYCLPYLLISLLSCWVPTKRALHMFQQNRYECGRYSAWFKQNWMKQFLLNGLLCLILCGLLFIFTDGIYSYVGGLVLAAINGFVLLQNEKKKDYIKPLHCTDRVKRQIVVMALLQGLILVLAY